MPRFTPVGLAIIALAVGFIGLATFQGVTVATHVFTDVPNGAFYHQDAETIKQLNITNGCNPGGTMYCPSDYTTRGEMASFLARTAGLYRAAYDQDQLGIGNIGTTPTTIASGTVEAPADCVLLMNGAVEWGDNGNSNFITTEWYVDGVLVPGSPDWETERGGSNLLDNVTAIAFQEVGEGSHTVELKADASSGTVSVYDVAMFALCVPFDGSGDLVTP